MKFELLTREPAPAERPLAESHWRFAGIYDFSPTAYVTVDSSERIQEANVSAAELFGTPRTILIGQSLREFVAEYDRAKLRNHLQQCRVGADIVTTELHLMVKEGMAVPVRLSCSAYDEHGAHMFHCAVVDLSERKQAAATLDALMLEYQAVLENAFDGVALVRNRIIVRCNHRLEQMFGHQPGEMAGLSTETLYASRDDWERTRKLTESTLAGRNTYQGEHVLRRKDGSVFWCIVAGLAVDPFDPGKGSIWRLQDITERKTAEEALRNTQAELAAKVRSRTAQLSRTVRLLRQEISDRIEIETKRQQQEMELERSREKLRQLSSHLQSVREAERAKIAREIHDELGATLTALKMDLSWIAKNSSGRSRTSTKLLNVMQVVDSAIQAVRRIATDLRPSVLDNLGLWAAIEWQAQEMQDRLGIEIRLEIPVPEDELLLDQDRATALFRIVQEALTNVARHADASWARIRAETTDTDVIIEVADNGKGMNEAQLIESKSLGLLGMHERARYYGGEIRVSSEPGNGTTVRVRLPLGGSQ